MRALLIYWAASLIALPALAGGEITETALIIGRDGAVVREVRRVTLQAGEQDLILDNIPAQADLSSLTIRMRRLPVQLLRWERISASTVEPTPISGPRISLGQSAPLTQSEPATPIGAVRCRVMMPLSGERTIEITYRLRGIEWRVEYDVSLQSSMYDRAERIPLDLTGILQIDNQTDRSFSNALVRLVGGDPRLDPPERHRRGFLMLADIPFADLWLADRGASPLQEVYRLPRRFDLPAQASTRAAFIRAERISASRLFVMDEREVPLLVADTLSPLDSYLVIPNTAANQLGWNLPPGPVFLSGGSVPQSSLLEGFMPHTAIGRPIRIHVGKSAYVDGARQVLRRIDLAPDRYLEIYQLTLRSRLAYPVPVEIRERPPKRLIWRVDRANAEYEQERGFLLFQPILAAEDTRRIELGIEFRLP